MSKKAAHSWRHLARDLRFLTGALGFLFVVHVVFAAGVLRSDLPAERGPAPETGRQDRLENFASYPVGSAARTIEIRLAPDRVSERKSDTGGDVPASEPSGMTRKESGRLTSEAIEVAGTTSGRQLYHLHRALLL